jgi:hypothetical protein
MFRSTMFKVVSNPLVIVVMNDENLLTTLSEANKTLDRYIGVGNETLNY